MQSGRHVSVETPEGLDQIVVGLDDGFCRHQIYIAASMVQALYTAAMCACMRRCGSECESEFVRRGRHDDDE